MPLLGPLFGGLLRQNDLQRRSAELIVNVHKARQELGKESAFLGVEGGQDPLLNAVGGRGRERSSRVACTNRSPASLMKSCFPRWLVFGVTRRMSPRLSRVLSIEPMV